RERGRLAGAGRSCDQDEAPRLVAQLLDHRGQVQLLEPLDLEGDLAEHAGDRAALVEDVGAEPGQALDPERQVDLKVLFKTVLLIVRQDGVAELFGLRRGHWIDSVERLEMAMDPDLRR